MTIEIRCSVCGRPARFSDDKAGRQATCRQCGANLKIPGNESGSRQTSSSASRKTPRKGDRKSKTEGASGGMIGGIILAVAVVAAAAYSFLGQGATVPTPGDGAVAGNPRAPGAPPAAAPSAGDPSLPTYRVSKWTAQADPPRAAIPAPIPDFRIVGLGARSPRTERVTYSATASPFVLIGEGEGSARDTRELWDLSTGRIVKEFRSSRLPARTIAISPDGRWIAWYEFGGESGLRIADIQKEEVVGRNALPPAEMSIDKFAFASPERLIGLSNGRAAIGIWKVPSGERERVLQLETGADIASVHTISPGGRYLACAHAHPDRGLTVFDLETGAAVGAIGQSEMKSITVQSMAFSPDGRELAAVAGQGFGNDDVRLLTWNVATGAPVDDLVLAGTGGSVHALRERDPHSLQWFANPRRLLLGGRSVIDRDAKRIVLSLDTPEKGIETDVSRHVLSNGMIASWETTRSPPAIVPLVVQDEDVTQSISIAAGGGELSDARLPRLTAFNRRQAVDRSRIPTAWKVVADPAPPRDPPANPVPIDVGTARLREIAVTRLDPVRVCVRLADGEKEFTYHVPPRLFQIDRKPYPRFHWSFQPAACRQNSFLIIDPSQPATTTRFSIDSPCHLLAISPDGGKLLVSAIDGPGRLDVFTTTGTHVCGCRPFSDDPKPELRTIDQGEFIDPHTVVVTSVGERLTAFRIPACEPMYQAQEATALALSPGGTLIATATDKQIEFRDAMTGEGRGVVPLPSAQSGIRELSFSPAGDRLAALTTDSSRSLVVIDLKNGATASLAIPHVERPLSWVGSDRLLVGRTDSSSTSVLTERTIRLIDLRQQAPVWVYEYGRTEPISFSMDSGDQRLWVGGPVQGSKEIQLTALTIPDAAVASRIEEEDLAAQVVLKPGMSVSLRFDLPPPAGPPDYLDRLRKLVEHQLQTNGLKVEPNQSITYVIQGEIENHGEPATMRTFGNTPAAAKVQPRKFKGRLSYMSAGRTLWEGRFELQNGIGLVRFDNQTGAQQALDEDLWKNAAMQITSMTPPLRLYAGSTGEGSGTSRLKGNGAFPVK